MNFIKKYTLIANSPLIHFQWSESEAVLRATEVKPKLDSYLENCSNFSPEWRISKEKKALNYKMRISQNGKREIVTIGQNASKKKNLEESYSIYYGNQGIYDEDKKKKGVICNLTLEIICFNKNLQEFIDQNITDFFLVTNFGSMQRKGFGSYYINKKPHDTEYVIKTLKKHYFSTHCYYFSTIDMKNCFRCIKTIYSLLKSGINLEDSRGIFHRSLLVDYMHQKKSIGNEKAWLKQNRIAPAIGRSSDQKDERNYYIRGLLGISEQMEFLKEEGNFKDKVKISIKSLNSEIERISSPIFFKVINNTVFFIATPINKKIYGCNFKFSSPMCPAGKTISIPTENELGDNFLDEFLEFSMPKLKGYLKSYSETKNLTIIRG